MDVICAQCGEPWDYYGIEHGDFEEEEDIEPFFRGDFCPSCKNHPERRLPSEASAKEGQKDEEGLGRFWEQHLETLLDATDDPDRFIPYLPW